MANIKFELIEELPLTEATQTTGTCTLAWDGDSGEAQLCIYLGTRNKSQATARAEDILKTLNKHFHR